MHSPIARRITKLLRLARCKGATAAEASTALEKAQRIAAEHHVSLNEIHDDDDRAGALTHSSKKVRKGLTTRLTAGIVQSHFGVQCITISRGAQAVMHIVGMPDQVEIATYIFVYVRRLLDSAWASRENKRLRDRDSYLLGFAWAISEKVPGVFRNEGLILSQDAYINRYLTPENCVTVKAPQLKGRLSPSAVHAGFTAGHKANLHNALRNTEAQALLPI